MRSTTETTASTGGIASAITPPPPPTSPSRHEIDLRRKGGRKAGAAILLERADWLALEERSLIAAVYRENLKVSAIAAMSGTAPSTVRARLRRVLQRINDPSFAFVLANRDSWTAPMRRVATACFLHGWTLRRAAAELDMSIASVRRYRDAVIALHETQSSTTAHLHHRHTPGAVA